MHKPCMRTYLRQSSGFSDLVFWENFLWAWNLLCIPLAVCCGGSGGRSKGWTTKARQCKLIPMFVSDVASVASFFCHAGWLLFKLTFDTCRRSQSSILTLSGIHGWRETWTQQMYLSYWIGMPCMSTSCCIAMLWRLLMSVGVFTSFHLSCLFIKSAWLCKTLAVQGISVLLNAGCTRNLINYRSSTRFIKWRCVCLDMFFVSVATKKTCFWKK